MSVMLAEWIKEASEPTNRSSFQRAVEAKAEALQAHVDRLIDNFIRVYTFFAFR